MSPLSGFFENRTVIYKFLLYSSDRLSVISVFKTLKTKSNAKNTLN